MSRPSLTCLGMSQHTLNTIDLEGIIRAHPREGVKLSDKRIRSYGLMDLRASNGRDGRLPGGYVRVGDITYYPWLDTPYALVLTHKGHPQALAGIEEKKNLYLIKQIQGIRGTRIKGNRIASSRHLAPIEWQCVLVKSVAALARMHNVPEIAIMPANQNPWVQERNKNRELFERVAKHYDGTAKRLGFRKERRSGWSLVRWLTEQPKWYRTA